MYCSCRGNLDTHEASVRFECRSVEKAVSLVLPDRKVVIIFDELRCDNHEGAVGGTFAMGSARMTKGHVAFCGAAIAFSYDQNVIQCHVDGYDVNISEGGGAIRIGGEQWRAPDEGLAAR
jgi:hypothetical protein